MSEVSSPDLLFEGLSDMEFFRKEELVKQINEELHVSRANRVRAAMFPETLPAGIAIPSTRMFSQQETAVEKLSQPSQMLKEAIRNLINYQEDADINVDVIPELLLLLKPMEVETCANACKMVRDLTKNDASRHAMARNADFINALLQTVSNSQDVATIEDALGALKELTKNEQGLLAIFQSGGIPILVAMLRFASPAGVRYAISTLHNLIQFVDDADKEVAKCGGIQNMVDLLNWDDAKFLTIVVDCLRMLAHSNQERKLIILSRNGHLSLVEILRKLYDYEKLHWVTMRALKVLSVCSCNKPAIVQAGGLQAIGHYLQHPSHRVRINCLYTISNLSDAACQITDGAESVLDILIKNLDCDEKIVLTLSVEILANMSCNNPTSKERICAMGGIERVFNVIIRSMNEKDMNTVETGLRLVRHLTSRHPGVYEAQQIIREQGRIGVIASLVRLDCEMDIIKAVFEVVINLLQFEENLVVLNELNVASRIEAGFLRCFSAYNLEDSDDINVLYECSLNALNVFARNAQVRKVLSKEDLIPCVVQLLDSPIANIQKYAVGLLCELANEADGIKLIEECDPGEILTLLMDTQDETLAPYAAMILYKLSNNQPAQYRQQLRSEIIKYPLFQYENLASPDVMSQKDTEIYVPASPMFESGEYTYSSEYGAVPLEEEQYQIENETRLHVEEAGLRHSVGIVDAEL